MFTNYSQKNLIKNCPIYKNYLQNKIFYSYIHRYCIAFYPKGITKKLLLEIIENYISLLHNHNYILPNELEIANQQMFREKSQKLNSPKKQKYTHSELPLLNPNEPKIICTFYHNDNHICVMSQKLCDKYLDLSCKFL